MNELEEWFLEEFGPLGFSLTPMMYSPESYEPFLEVIYEGEVLPHIKITPELAMDLSDIYGVDAVGEYRNLVRSLILREEKKPKDFKPTQKLNKFKL